MEQVSLTSAEKNKIQNEKQIYVLLRLIHYVQRYYNSDRIDKNTYEAQFNRLLEKFKRFSQIIPNFNIDSFCRTFHIPNQQIALARHALQKYGNPQDQNNASYLFIQATSTFISVLDNMTPKVGQSKNMLQSLQLIVPKLCKRLKSSEFNQKSRNFQTLLQNYVLSRGFSDIMTQSEFQQIKLTVSGLLSMMAQLTKN